LNFTLSPVRRRWSDDEVVTKMKDILLRLLIAAALTLAAFVLSSSMHGEQPDKNPTKLDLNPPRP